VRGRSCGPFRGSAMLAGMENMAPSRRRFLSRVSIALSTAVAAVVGVPVVGFLLSPLARKVPRQWRAVGQAGSFKVGETVSVTFDDASPLPWSGVTARTAAWLRRDDAESFTAFAVNCTHLGCPVRWPGEVGGGSSDPALCDWHSNLLCRVRLTLRRSVVWCSRLPLGPPTDATGVGLTGIWLDLPALWDAPVVVCACGDRDAHSPT
jgi:Rieske Fe-S protein